MKTLMILALTLALCVGAPVTAFAAEASQPADTQTEEIEVASTSPTPANTKPQSATTPKTGDSAPLAVPAVLAGAALVAGGAALSRAREQ